MKRISSVVWQFFDRLEENNRCVAVLCKLCDTEYKFFGNTTNLRAHLIKKHPLQWEFSQSNVDGQDEGAKPIVDTTITEYDDDEQTNLSTVSSKRRKYRSSKDENVCYSLSPSELKTSEEEVLPKIEIQRVDALGNSESEHYVADVDEDAATLNLVRQMHDDNDQESGEEWLEDDYQINVYEPKPKKPFRKIKRKIVQTPSTYITRTPSRHQIIEQVPKDEYSVFGEYIANKLRKFKAARTRGNIQQIITTILWQAEYGLYDDADSVKRILMAGEYGHQVQDSTQDANIVIPAEYTE